ncbi:MAG: glycosyltransferase family 4 protein [Gemmatimonadetes bacterium]|nr:glycosyltransferase family 4 protein [Gemmatimonadota bacterium]
MIPPSGGSHASRPKLLFVVTEDWYFVSHRLPLARAAAKAGFDVAVATRVRDMGSRIAEAGIRVIPFEIARASLNPVIELATLLRLITLYRTERPHVAHHVALKPVLYGGIAAIVTGTPRVVNAVAGLGWLHGAERGPTGWVKAIARRLIALVLRRGTLLVQNPDDAKVLVALGVPASRIREVRGAGVDLEEFASSVEPGGVPLVILPARLLWDKGVEEFVNAAVLVREHGIDARFALVGEPDPANRRAVPAEVIRHWVERGWVEHFGWVADMPVLLARAHVVCLPSYYGEGIPKALIEAAASGRAIVTTDTPGCREIVHDEDNGILVPPRDVPALANALERLLTSPDLRRRMGSRGRSRAEAEFSQEAVIAQTISLYSDPAR